MKPHVPVWFATLFLASTVALRAAPCSYTVTIPTGYSMIANHCDIGANLLNSVLNGVPAGSQLVKFNKQTQAFDPPAVYNGTAWSPAGVTLSPGEGGFFFNPGAPFTHTFNGNAHTPTLPITLPMNGCCIISAQRPVQGSFFEMTGHDAPGPGCAFYRYNPATGAYSVHVYDPDVGWDPTEPVLNVGESGWICCGGAAPTNGLPTPTPPCVTNLCVTFDDGTLNGFHGLTPCENSTPGVSLTVQTPGPSGAGTDFYLRARDLSGPSRVQNYSTFNGDWRCLAAKGCAELCWDFRLFIDGNDSGTLNITPSVVLVSDPDGPCGPQPPVRAVFTANFTVTEDGGTNAGWHRICAPLGLASGTNLPSNAQGSWSMVPPATPAQWDLMLANITGIQFPIDFTSNPAEEAGYDNICLTETNCEDCVIIVDKEIKCVSTNGIFQYTFCLTNKFNGPLNHVVFPDTPGFVVLPDPIFDLNPPLLLNQGTTMTVTLQATNNPPATNACFLISVHNEDFVQCCATEHCFEVPPCCALITNECVTCDTNGNFILTFTYVNLSGLDVKFIYLVPEDPGFQILPYMLPNPLPSGQSVTISIPVVYTGAGCPPELCVLISSHDARFNECCAIRECFALPVCCKPRTYTLDADFDLGTLVNVNHDPNHHQLQLNAVAKPLPYVAIPCSARGTVARIDINSGAVLGEYLSSPNGMGPSPSRTTVDKFGNVWVGNRDEVSGGKGSVVRIGLIIGGIRGDKIANVFVPNPTGFYIKNPTYSTCIDRDGDGLIKTSRGLGDILSWSNAASADSNGGVSTAEDECITIYTRVTGSGTRFLAIDCNNDLWVGGTGFAASGGGGPDYDFEKLDGVTGLPVPLTQFNPSFSAYGGLVDGNNILWSSQTMLRHNTQTMISQQLPLWAYGVGINPLDCRIWLSYARQNVPPYTIYDVAELNSSGAVVNTYPGVGYGLGLCVDGNGHVWIAQGNRIAHFAPNGPSHILVGFVTGNFQYVRGVAVDSNGRIWGADDLGNQAIAINPAGGAIGGGGYNIGAVIMNVSLGNGSRPYNYSDMTGFVALSGNCRSGSWTLIHEGCGPGIDWGTISWNATVPANASLVVEYRAADDKASLPSKPFKPAKNGASFCGTGITGQFLEIRVRFTGPPCSTITPILHDLTVDCCPSDPCTRTNRQPVVECPEPITLCSSNSASVTLGLTVTDADGDPLTVTWRIGNQAPFETDNVPGGSPNPTVATVTATRTFTAGQTVVIVAVNDGSGFRDVCDIIVNIGDKIPPTIKCPPGVRFAGFQGSVPNFIPGAMVADNCTPAPALIVTQSPPAGTPVGIGNHVVTLTVRDAAGNTATCQTTYTVSTEVRLVTPANYTVAFAPATVALEAAVNPTSRVQFVRFRSNGAVVGQVTNPPYRATLNLTNPGLHSFEAEAVGFNSAERELSDARAFTLLSGAGTPRPEMRQPLIQNLSNQGGEVSFWLATQPGVTAYVEFTEDLAAPEWRILKVVGGDGFPVEVSAPATTRQMFFRIRVQ